MAFVDGTAVLVALPALGEELGADFAGFQWVINGYLLPFTALVLVGGALGDVYGRRRIFVAGAATFVITSLACAAAPSTPWLVAGRVLQGVGAALLVPSSLAMLQAAFPPGERGRAIGAWSGFSGLSTIVGPVLGGWLVETLSWRSIFLLNLPIGALAAALALRHVPESRHVEASRRPDFLGGLWAAAALGGFVFALIEGPERGWGRPPVWGAAVLGVLALAAFLVRQRRCDHPMLPLRLFRNRRFSGANAVTLLVYIATGVFFLLTLQLQRVLGYSAFEAGAATAPVTLLILVLSPWAGKLADRHGPRPLLIAGPLVAAVGVVLLRRVEEGVGYWGGVLPGVAVFGVGLGLLVAPITAAALSALDDSRSGVASGVNNAVSRLAQTLAIPLLPLAAGISGIETVGGAEFSRGFALSMWIVAGFLVAGATLAHFTLGGALDPRAERAGDAGEG